MQENTSLITDRITINNQTLFVGHKYRVTSPHNNPWASLTLEARERKGILPGQVHYDGVLTQVPVTDTRTGKFIGNCLYFQIPELDYHEGFRHCEPLSMIQNGTTTIVPL